MPVAVSGGHRPHLAVGLEGSPGSVGELARRAELAGFESVWFAELERSAFVAAAAAIGATARIGVGTAVTLAFPRSPTITAMEAADLDELSGGRFRLGLGTQIRQILERRYSVPFEAPAAKLAEYVAAVRTVWAARRGDAVIHEGRFYRITMPTFHGPPRPASRDVPIHLAAVGPIMARTAGAVADGLIAHPIASRRYVTEIVAPAVEAGRASRLSAAGRPEPGRPFELTASPLVAVVGSARELDRARRGLKLQVAFYATTPAYAPILDLHDRAGLGRELRRAFARGDRERLVALVDDALLDAIAIAGGPGEIRDALAGWTGIADRLLLAGAWYGQDEAAIADAAAALIEALAPAGGSPGEDRPG